MITGPSNESGASDQAPKDRKPNTTSKASVARLKVPQRVRPGILAYRQQRSVVDFSRAIQHALLHEATLREQAGTPDQWLRDAAAWIDRECLPQ